MKTVKILVVDDDPEQAEILSEILASEERDITVSTKSKEAIEMIRKNHYDIIFTDISMPEIDGLQLIKQAKETSPNTKFVPITAFGDWGVYSETLQLGVQEFLNKPYNIPEIQNLVKKLSASI